MKDFFAGVKLLGQGMRAVGRSPRLILLGMIPALLSVLLFAGLWTLLIMFYTDVVDAATWYTRDWESTFQRGAVEIATGVGIAGVSVLFTLVSFTAITLLIGDPFYEKISETVEDRLGGVPGAVDTPWWRSLPRSAVDSLRLMLLTLLIAIPLFLFGLVPVVGQIVGAILGGAVGGWFLSVELTGIPFYRRGLRLRDRRRLLRQHRRVALGFGVAVFLCFLIPLGTILVMPAAVAGGTLLTRRVFGQPIQ